MKCFLLLVGKNGLLDFFCQLSKTLQNFLSFLCLKIIGFFFHTVGGRNPVKHFECTPQKIETNSTLKWPGSTPPQLVFWPEIDRSEKWLMQGYSWMLIRITTQTMCSFEHKRFLQQGWFHYQPKQCIIIWETPENYHTCKCIIWWPLYNRQLTINIRAPWPNQSHHFAYPWRTILGVLHSTLESTGSQGLPETHLAKILSFLNLKVLFAPFPY